VFRRTGPDGKYKEDVVCRCADRYEDATPLLGCVMSEGRRLNSAPALPEVQRRAREEIARLPDSCRRLHNAVAYPVRFSRKLQQLLEEFRNRVSPAAGKPSVR
jgi:nicotinate phosphoribosyltransferase